jgi:histidyl-tRNA synthetase
MNGAAHDERSAQFATIENVFAYAAETPGRYRCYEQVGCLVASSTRGKTSAQRNALLTTLWNCASDAGFGDWFNRIAISRC